MPPSGSWSSSKLSSKFYRPYFSSQEVEFLSEKQRGKQTATQEEKVRQSACTFIEGVGARIGFPRRTIATAQSLYHRFHLFFPRKDFQYYDVSLTAIFVSAKMHDTLKKPRELLAVSYAIRFPELAAKSKQYGGDVDLDAMEPSIVEADRQRLLAIERLILETVCFNFTSKMPFPYVIKLGKELKAPKKLIKFAWRIAIDCHRTLLPLIYPPHSIALGSIYVASLLLSFEQPPSPSQEGELGTAAELATMLSQHADWEEKYKMKAEDLDDIAHTFFDLLIPYVQSSSSANTSPSTPSSPSPHLSRDRQQHQPHHLLQLGQAQQQSLFGLYTYNADQLIRLKIFMRKTEHTPRKAKEWCLSKGSGSGGSGSSVAGGTAKSGNVNVNEGLGQNDGTTRFSFFPPGFDVQMER